MIVANGMYDYESITSFVACTHGEQIVDAYDALALVEFSSW